MNERVDIYSPAPKEKKDPNEIWAQYTAIAGELSSLRLHIENVFAKKGIKEAENELEGLESKLQELKDEEDRLFKEWTAINDGEMQDHRLHLAAQDTFDKN